MPARSELDWGPGVVPYSAVLPHALHRTQEARGGFFLNPLVDSHTCCTSFLAVILLACSLGLAFAELLGTTVAHQTVRVWGFVLAVSYDVLHCATLLHHTVLLKAPTSVRYTGAGILALLLVLLWQIAVYTHAFLAAFPLGVCVFCIRLFLAWDALQRNSTFPVLLECLTTSVGLALAVVPSQL